PLQYVPGEARFADGDYQPIDTFSTDPGIFDAVLTEVMLSHDPARNRLWQLIKGNFRPMLALKMRQAKRRAGHAFAMSSGSIRSRTRAAGHRLRHLRHGRADRDEHVKPILNDAVAPDDARSDDFAEVELAP